MNNVVLELEAESSRDEEEELLAASGVVLMNVISSRSEGIPRERGGVTL